MDLSFRQGSARGYPARVRRFMGVYAKATAITLELAPFYGRREQDPFSTLRKYRAGPL